LIRAQVGAEALDAMRHGLRERWRTERERPSSLDVMSAANP
jgi:hypothetical protein